MAWIGVSGHHCSEPKRLRQDFMKMDHDGGTVPMLGYMSRYHEGKNHGG